MKINNDMNVTFGGAASHCYVKGKDLLGLSKWEIHKRYLVDSKFVVIPDLFQAAINRACNLRCKYCPNSFEKSIPEETMPMNLFEKIMLDLRGIKYDETLTFHGYGEPLLIPAEEYIKTAGEIVPTAKKKLFTNGLLLTNDRLESLFAAGVDEIMVTQHTPKGFIDRLREIPEHYLRKIFVRYSDEMKMTNRAGGIGDAVENYSGYGEPCLSSIRVFNVRPNGEVPMCDDDYYLKKTMGNFNFENLIEILTKNKLRMIARFNGKKRNDLCAQCDRFSLDNPTVSASNSGHPLNSAIYRKKLLEETGSAHLSSNK